jgi:hypothetical protein
MAKYAAGHGDFSRLCRERLIFPMDFGLPSTKITLQIDDDLPVYSGMLIAALPCQETPLRVFAYRY